MASPPISDTGQIQIPLAAIDSLMPSPSRRMEVIFEHPTSSPSSVQQNLDTHQTTFLPVVLQLADVIEESVTQQVKDSSLHLDGEPSRLSPPQGAWAKPLPDTVAHRSTAVSTSNWPELSTGRIQQRRSPGLHSKVSNIKTRPW
ncbi:unnamed protein product [Arabis nemorensis]|uniref:Uncharacterized protein n=1 Tax=Arabis nemorensis TaxID=586526 RepID=A0A565AQG4_9BRAS|nr:unnamed protein product [Arabis nemorensis]